MARKPINTDLGTELLQPAARPVDLYVTPAPSKLRGLADSLSAIDKPLRQFIDQRAEKQAEEDRIRGEAAFYDDNAEDIGELVQTGKLPAHYSPNFVRGFKSAQGNVLGNQLRAKFNAAYDAWGGKDSEDPEAYDQFVKGFIAENLNTTDPDVLKTLLPQIRALDAGGFERYTQDRHERTVKGSLDAHVAGANQDIDEANREGLSTEEGTNYPVVFEKIAEQRAQYVSTGGNGADFDKTMIDAMSAKVLATRDPGLLAWFDQPVPGESYTYGDSPYGSQVKLQTTEALEVIARRQVGEEATAQRAADEKRKDEAQRSAIDFLVANPSAPMPDGILKAGEVDPLFKVHIEEWRKSLGAGFSDPAAIKHVYAEIIGGGGVKAVTDAFAQGVFGRPEDLRDAYAWAKTFEDNRDRITGVTSGSTFERFMKDIDIGTKGKVEFYGDPIEGTSPEGYEAQYDFRRMVTEWVLKNPEASLLETEEAVNKIGKAVMDRFVLPEGYERGDPTAPASTYERAGDMPFDNPFTDGTTPVPTDQGADVPPTGGDRVQAERDAEDTTDLIDGLTPGQRSMWESAAEAQGLSLEEYVKRYILAPPSEPATASPISYQPGTPRPTSGTPVMDQQTAMRFLDEAMVAQPDDDVEVSGGGDPTRARLRSLIGQHEAGGNYNAVYGNAKSTRDLSQYSVNQIIAMQTAAIRRGSPSSAIGKGQFLKKTLKGLRDELGLTGNEKFTPKLQDRLMDALLDRRGYQAFKAGKLSKRQFALRLSQEWASLPNPNTGRSYYAGDGLNTSSAKPSAVYAALGM